MPARTLAPNATLVQATAYVKTYQNKVNRLGRSCNPMFKLHKSTLDLAKSTVENPQVKVYLCMSVIASICDGCVMAPNDFSSTDVFTVLRESLLLMARDVQVGAGMDKESILEWVEEECLEPIEDSIRRRGGDGPGPRGLARYGAFGYVTTNESDGGYNFAGKELGDWGAMLEEFRDALDLELDDDALAAVVETRAQEEVETAEGALEEQKKEVEKARKQLVKLEKKQTTAENKVKKAKRALEQAAQKRKGCGFSCLAEDPVAKKGKKFFAN